MSGSNTVYFDAKSLSDILFHLFMVMNNELARDGYQREYVDLLLHFSIYIRPYLNEKEKAELQELRKKVLEAKKTGKNTYAIIKLGDFLMEKAKEHGFLRKGVESASEIETFMRASYDTQE